MSAEHKLTMSTEPVKPSAEDYEKAIAEIRPGDSDDRYFYAAMDIHKRAIAIAATRNSSAPAQQGVDGLLSEIDLRFTSGNSAPVERGYITAEQWKILRPILAARIEQPKAQPSSAEVVAWEKAAVTACAMDEPPWQLLLTEDQALQLAAMLLDDGEGIVTKLIIGDGHSGYGLYVAQHEYLEEGALFVAKCEPNYTTAAALPIPELLALCESWSHNSTDERKCADELRALIDKHGKE